MQEWKELPVGLSFLIYNFSIQFHYHRTLQQPKCLLDLLYSLFLRKLLLKHPERARDGVEDCWEMFTVLLTMLNWWLTVKLQTTYIRTTSRQTLVTHAQWTHVSWTGTITTTPGHHWTLVLVMRKVQTYVICSNHIHYNCPIWSRTKVADVTADKDVMHHIIHWS